MACHFKWGIFVFSQVPYISGELHSQVEPPVDARGEWRDTKGNLIEKWIDWHDYEQIEDVILRVNRKIIEQELEAIGVIMKSMDFPAVRATLATEVNSRTAMLEGMERIDLLTFNKYFDSPTITEEEVLHYYSLVQSTLREFKDITEMRMKNLVMLALSCFAGTCSAPVMMKRNPRAKC